MDPLTHGLLGGVAAQALFGRRLPRSAWLIGAAAGMAADLDIFIRPASDPLGGISFHRNFTHALAFIPIGALVCAAVFWPWKRFAGYRVTVYLAALVAYAMHGLLDACTSYGTVLFWPFTERRVAWDLIGIIDLLFTLTLLTGLIVSVVLRRRRIAVAAFGVALAYMGLGFVQHTRAAAVQQQLAQLRGESITRGRVMPTPLNLVLWRGVYVSNGQIHADSIRVPLIGEPEAEVGKAAELVTHADIAAAGWSSPVALRAFDRFAWFADGYTAWDESAPRVVGDMRYGLRADEFRSMWGLRMPAPGSATPPVFTHNHVPRGDRLRGMWDAVIGRDPAYKPVSTLATITP